ncbi:transcription factor SRM1-like [Curcuma longa]|uniref:transcription factor SRM1-like n=1 Tax=Curcuma longa TaxID=136217 RepID=UPI003D9ED5EC
MVMEVEGCGSSWTRDQEKAFENALATHPEDCSERWEKIAADVPGKTVEDVKDHYDLLVEDVNRIQSGRVPLPSYPSPSDGADHATDTGGGKKGWHGNGGDGGHSGKASRAEQERRKGIAWTEDEHRLFLLGLDKYGKGDWRSISRNFVISRTPTQVASHAQKYFIRLNSMNKERRRTSIHDITSVGNGDVSAPQGLITGHVSGSATNTMKPIKGSSQPSGTPPAVNGHGATIGQPVAGPLIPTVGTPVNFPAPRTPHIAYGSRAPVSASVVSGAPVSIPPATHR